MEDDDRTGPLPPALGRTDEIVVEGRPRVGDGSDRPVRVRRRARVRALTDPAAYRPVDGVDVAEKAGNRIRFEGADETLSGSVLAGGRYLRLEGRLFEIVDEGVAERWRSVLESL